MDEQNYINDRLEDQLAWYDKKSQDCQSRFKMLRLAEIVSAAIIPFLSGAAEKIPYSNWIIGILGVVIAVAAAAISLYKYQENWIQYRTTAEQLKHEKFLFLTGTKPYHTPEKFSLLVEHVEGLISKENSFWAQATKMETDEKKDE